MAARLALENRPVYSGFNLGNLGDNDVDAAQFVYVRSDLFQRLAGASLLSRGSSPTRSKANIDSPSLCKSPSES